MARSATSRKIATGRRVSSRLRIAGHGLKNPVANMSGFTSTRIATSTSPSFEMSISSYTTRMKKRPACGIAQRVNTTKRDLISPSTFLNKNTSSTQRARSCIRALSVRGLAGRRRRPAMRTWGPAAPQRGRCLDAQHSRMIRQTFL